MASVLLVFHAVESDLKGHVSIVFLPVPLESAPVLTFFGGLEGWMLEFLRSNVQVTAASLLHWQSGFERECVSSSSLCFWILVSSNMLHMFGKVSLQRMKVKSMFPS